MARTRRKVRKGTPSSTAAQYPSPRPPRLRFSPGFFRPSRRLSSGPAFSSHCACMHALSLGPPYPYSRNGGPQKKSASNLNFFHAHTPPFTQVGPPSPWCWQAGWPAWVVAVVVTRSFLPCPSLPYRVPVPEPVSVQCQCL